MMSQLSQHLRLEIDSQLCHTSMVAMAVRGVCALTTMSPVDINRVELCLVEVVNNVIEHGYHNEAGHPVEVCVVLEKERISLSVSDWGVSIPDGSLTNSEMLNPDPDEPATWLSSGRGLHIVNQIMDEVSYDTKENKNCFTMHKSFGS